MVLLFVGISLLGGCGIAGAGMDGGDRAGGFYLAASEYYNIPEREIIVIRQRHIGDEEIPVVLFIARKARVPYAGVLDMRARGLSWMEITHRYRLNPEIYYVPVRGFAGPPYGKAYGYYKKRRGEVMLDDEDIVNLVNLGFLSRYYGYPPERIMRMRSAGRSFVGIQTEMSRGVPVRSPGWERNRGGRPQAASKYGGERGRSELHRDEYR